MKKNTEISERIKQIIDFVGVSCELLSFFSIFGIQNNSSRPSIQQATVVNCFHFSVSLGYKTTLYLLETK